MDRKTREQTFCRDVCKAWCCKYIVVNFDVNENMKPIEDEQFFRLRGISINLNDSTLIVPCRCKWLTNRNTCKLYPWRPETCKSFRCEQLNTLKDNIVT